MPLPNTSVQVAELTDSSLLLERCHFDGLAGEPSVAVAVSGGSDSMALLHLTQQATSGAIRLVALTVDHGLRAESSAEARQVAEWCGKLGIEHVVLPWRGAKPATGIQAAARKARYDLMSAWCLDHAVQVLLTGHSANDQAETYAMRSKRTTSVLSRSGILPIMHWNGVRVLRPLLAVTREELRQYLRARGQVWIEDPSNAQSRYERVRVRAALPQADVAGLAAAAEAARRMSDAARAQMIQWLQAHATVDAACIVHVPRAAFAAATREVQALILRELIATCGGQRGLAQASVISICRAVAAGALGKRTLGGVVIVFRKATLLAFRELGRINPEPVTVPDSGHVLWDKRFVVTAAPQTRIRALGLAQVADRPRGVPAAAYAACPVLSGPGQWRLAWSGWH